MPPSSASLLSVLLPLPSELCVHACPFPSAAQISVQFTLASRSMNPMSPRDCASQKLSYTPCLQQICEHMTRRPSPVPHDSRSERGRLSPPSLLNDISGGSSLPPAAAVMREEKDAGPPDRRSALCKQGIYLHFFFFHEAQSQGDTGPTNQEDNVNCTLCVKHFTYTAIVRCHTIL